MEAWTRAARLQRDLGMEVMGRFVAVDEEDLYIWNRRFEKETGRKCIYDWATVAATGRRPSGHGVDALWGS